MRLDKVVLGVVLELQSPAMSVTNKELEGRFITDLRPELCRRDMRTQAPDLGNPQGCKPSPPRRWRNNASERRPITWLL